MMPEMNGYELTESLRDANYDLPILMVTAKDQFVDMQKGFRVGADDYMIKPINVKELVLRVEALLRRAKISSDKKITVGSTVLNNNQWQRNYSPSKRILFTVQTPFLSE